MATTETNRAESEEFQKMFEELLAAAEAASHALHTLHHGIVLDDGHMIAVRRGICEWKPCQTLRDALVKASQEKWL